MLAIGLPLALGGCFGAVATVAGTVAGAAQSYVLHDELETVKAEQARLAEENAELRAKVAANEQALRAPQRLDQAAFEATGGSHAASEW